MNNRKKKLTAVTDVTQEASHVSDFLIDHAAKRAKINPAPSSCSYRFFSAFPPTSQKVATPKTPNPTKFVSDYTVYAIKSENALRALRYTDILLQKDTDPIDRKNISYPADYYSKVDPYFHEKDQLVNPSLKELGLELTEDTNTQQLKIVRR